MQMCIGALEAYLVRHGGNTGGKTRLETYGSLFGNEVELPDGKTFYSIEFFSVDTSAEMSRDSVVPNWKASELKAALLTSFFPQYSFMGDFHTHPYSMSYRDIRNQKLYRYSEQDFARVERDPKNWIQHGYRVGLVLTISRLKKNPKVRLNTQIDLGTTEFTLGQFRLWLKAYVAYLDEDQKHLQFADGGDVMIRCPSLEGLWQCTEFGGDARWLNGRTKKRARAV